ncbi:hypothetical protein B296_00034644 [Ensete ventricosum]|uniref:Uncharacterized protein n=1 Tax=Ensete ventricosum TaxID=4639 RepID=A0A426Z319_ENSVE|nr:hypothetical protein B296_00034644 [Ensete ventricosum]
MPVGGSAMVMKGCCEEADEALNTGENVEGCGWEAEAITRLRSGGDSVVGRLQQTLRVTAGGEELGRPRVVVVVCATGKQRRLHGWMERSDQGSRLEREAPIALTLTTIAGDGRQRRLQVVEEVVTVAEGNCGVRRAWVIVRLRLCDDDLFL